MNQLRQNVRNAMVPMTVSEAQDFQAGLVDRGQTEAAGYAGEFIIELEAECGVFDNWEG
jgi:hypothetical protein